MHYESEGVVSIVSKVTLYVKIIYMQFLLNFLKLKAELMLTAMPAISNTRFRSILRLGIYVRLLIKICTLSIQALLTNVHGTISIKIYE